MFCSSCGSQVSPTGKFCSKCGSRYGDPAAENIASGATVLGDDVELNAETIAPPTPRTPPSHPSGSGSRVGRSHSGASLHSSGSDPIGGGRFAPGQIVAERYRIVALAGRGGMGEVYRAEDLTLSQVVAIKFLPESFSQNEDALARFHSEVRIARQVSHSNVCRVFDIGEVEGISFLTMEYVDGEDMAALVRRIGRLSPDKATDIARQICAGLAAAHQRGVIHRDLKPANIMLDGEGKVRITDFGLAAIAANIAGGDVRAGTPAYMAPEQLAGKEVTAKSDLYSLGLVLYEILTGKRAFDATTLPELMKMRQESVPTSPATLVRDLDPLLERVILRCLETDPALRPASALQVAAALPGGDPLAAALAAGETPSPEMVAASGQSRGMRPNIAALCLLSIAVALVLLFALSSRIKLISLLPLRETPEVLTSQARDMIKRFGYTDTAADSAFFFSMNSDYLRYVQEHRKTASRWQVLRDDEPPAASFWYRESPRLLTSLSPADNLVYGRVTINQPSMDISGMTLVGLSPNGKLLHFEAVPPQLDTASGPFPTPDWNSLLAAAGLDPARFKSVPPKWFPLVWGDTRAAWEGVWPSAPDIPLRVEAAAFHGKPVYLDLISPWDRPQRMVPPARSAKNNVAQAFSALVLGSVIFFGVWTAARNIRLGRGDFEGARRLAVYIFIVDLVDWALLAHHVPSLFEFVDGILAISASLFFAGLTWLLYVALEPFLRRFWPDTLVSWVRMLKGQFRDPMIGRDILAGLAIGLAAGIYEQLQPVFEAALHLAPSRLSAFTLYPLEGIRGSFATLFYTTTQALTSGLLIFFCYYLLRRLFRTSWIALPALVLLYSVSVFGAEHIWVEALFSVPVIIVFIFCLYRFGLLALAAFFFADQAANNMAIATPLSAWYVQGGVLATSVILLLAFYAFQIARAGAPVFSKDLLDS